MILETKNGDKYLYCYRIDEFIQAMNLFHSHIKLGYTRLATDIETYCLPEYRGKVHNPATDPHTGDISLVSLCNERSLPIVFDVLLLEKQPGFTWDYFLDLFEAADYIVAHNAKFEIKWFRKKFNKFVKNFRCTYVLSVLLANATGSKFGRVRRHGLKHVARDLLNVTITGKGEEQITDWLPRPPGIEDKLDLEQLDFTETSYGQWKNKLDYGVGDILSLFKIHDLLYNTLTAPFPYSPLLDNEHSSDNCAGMGQGRVVDLEMRFLSTAARIEYEGLPASKYLLKLISNTLEDPATKQGVLTDLLAELCELLNLDFYVDPILDIYVIPESSKTAINNSVKLKKLIAEYCNLNSLDSAQAVVLNRLLDLFSELEEIQKQELQATDSQDKLFCSEQEAEKFGEIMQLSTEKLAANTKLFKLILEYKALKKMQGFKFHQYVNPVTGRIHGNFNQAAASTGRSSINQPPLQTVSGRVTLKVEIPSPNFYYIDGN